MVNAVGDCILAWIWFLMVLLACLTTESSAGGLLMEKSTKGPAVLADLHRHMHLVSKPAFP